MAFDSVLSDAAGADAVDAAAAAAAVAAAECKEEDDDEDDAAAAAGNSMLCKRSVEWRGSMNGPDLFDDDDKSDGVEDDDASEPDDEDACEEEVAEIVDVEAMGSEE